MITTDFMCFVTKSPTPGHLSNPGSPPLHSEPATDYLTLTYRWWAINPDDNRGGHDPPGGEGGGGGIYFSLDRVSVSQLAHLSATNHT